jgi:hypothetical protein
VRRSILSGSEFLWVHFFGLLRIVFSPFQVGAAWVGTGNGKRAFGRTSPNTTPWMITQAALQSSNFDECAAFMLWPVRLACAWGWLRRCVLRLAPG